MHPCPWYVVMLFALLSSTNLIGKIRNGYDRQLFANMVKLHALRMRVAEAKKMSLAERHSLKHEMNAALYSIVLYELTEELIYQLKVISPRIYYQSDTLRDKQRRPTDIYVKLIPKDSSRMKLAAASYVWQAAFDKDLSFSEYGQRSASIEIWICDRALFLFSHELGHLHYIIPNLATYTKFYKNTYSPKSKLSYVGHNRFDVSGRSADYFHAMFFRDRKEFLRNGGARPKSPLALIIPIKREIIYRAEHPGEIANQLRSPPLFWQSLVRRGP